MRDRSSTAAGCILCFERQALLRSGGIQPPMKVPSLTAHQDDCRSHISGRAANPKKVRICGMFLTSSPMYVIKDI